jgi:drug/metabolite transporter (DMT)-like permease
MTTILLFLFLGTLGWGISLYLIKLLIVSLSPADLVFYRALIGSLSLFMLAGFLKLKVSHFKDLLKEGLIVGLLNMALPFYLTSMAEKTVTSSLASILNGLTPLCSFLLGFCFFSIGPKRFNKLDLLSIFLGLGGVVLVNFQMEPEQGSLRDLLALVATCFSYGLAAHYVKSRVKTTEPLLVAAMSAFCSVLYLLAFKLGNGSLFRWSLPQGFLQIGSLLWLSVVGTGFSLYLYCILIKRIGAVRASMITYLMTLTGVLMGVLFLKEKMSVGVWFGCSCIVLSLILNNHAGALRRIFNLTFFIEREFVP